MAGSEALSAGFSEAERAELAARRWAVCVGQFHSDLAERLIGGAISGYAEAGIAPEAIDVHRVPGAFELPLAASYCAKSGRYAGVACLGAVIRGETDHYDFVCSEAAAGIARVSLDTGIPCAFGVITCETMAQALERSGGDTRDQGRNGALVTMRMYLLSLLLTE